MRRRAAAAACCLAVAALARAAPPDAAAWEAAAVAHAAAHEAQLTEEVIAFTAIPSVSAQPEHAADVRAASEWVQRKLLAMGAEHVALMETGVAGRDHPVVYGDWLHAPGAPTVLIYAHFDVQPAAGTEALWASPPFAPTRFEHATDGPSLRARGAADDKGPLAAALQGLQAVAAAGGGFPVNVKWLLEGQEEIGSPQLGAFIAKHGMRARPVFAFGARR